MSKLTILLAFHNHQPEGNFGHVFHQAYDDCYRPLLDAIADFPDLRLSLHHTGPLLEWLDRERPAYLDDLRALAARGQVEILGGGFYEPMLAVLPDADADGQLAMMNDFCAERLGQRPRGMWLAERVWEPSLAARIAHAGLGYTLLDDTHFRNAGVTARLEGHYVTDKAGVPLALFPIDQDLRYAIPFQPVDEAIRTLESLLDKAGRDLTLTYGDDGEKFGLWPGTKAWVWEQGWLRSFFARVTSNERLRTTTFSDALACAAPTGRVYPPTASYEEMGEWTLPADAQTRLHDARERLKHEGRLDELRPFLRGGIWQSFMAKYPEANLMHKKMVHVSRKVAAAAASGQDVAEARRALYRGQCNCAYWHGLFGGLYLNYLRHAVYANLIAAELAVEPPPPGARAERLDFDADLRDEVVLSNSELWVGIKPDAGGAFFELDVRPRRFNLANVVGRHAEAYHAKIRAAAHASTAPVVPVVPVVPVSGGDSSGDKPRSIHDIVVLKDPALEELLHYDRHPRFGFIDHLLAPGTTLDDFARSTHDERGDFAGAPYTLGAITSGDTATASLARTATLRDGQGSTCTITIEKRYALCGRRLTCAWRISRAVLGGTAHDTAAPMTALFAPELSLTLLAGDDAARRFVAPDRTLTDARMASRGVLASCPRLELHDDWSRFSVALSASGAPELWRFPLETASQSESGFERTYQGSVLAPVWPISLAPGDLFEAEVVLDVTLEPPHA